MALTQPPPNSVINDPEADTPMANEELNLATQESTSTLYNVID